MSVVVEIPAEYYNRLLAGAGQNTHMGSVFRSGVMLDHPEHKARRIVRIICEDSDAEMVLEIAQAVCREAVPEIQKSISRCREL
jgi:hypothetical protein